MKVFKEKQRFNQWWLYAIYIMILIVLIMGIYKNTEGFTRIENPVPVLFFLAAIIPLGVILWMQLETRIDREGIRVKFVPFSFSERFFSWKEIEKCYVRKYNPLFEYGGWGIRGLGRKKAYNVSGNLGIQIVRRDKKTFLIGTRKPEEARAVIRNFQHKIQLQPIITDMKYSVLFILIFTFQFAFAQESGITEENISIDKFTDGTLTLPENPENVPLVIFIQGSGPVNRDGNGPMMKNDGVKKISHELAENGIASFRFDKRIFKMDKLKVREQDLRFEDFVTDVNSILDHFSKEQNFSKIILAGHSEGSLIGILAAQNGKADAFISLAGAGRNINTIIVEQIAKQSEELSENAEIAFAEMMANGSTTNYSPYLESIFRPSVQPYILSWMKYDPAEEISKLDIPVLIVNGTFDLQVDVTDAEILQKANPDAELLLIENMNHIFREIKGENLENTKAYNEAHRHLHPELIPALTSFIKSIE